MHVYYDVQHLDGVIEAVESGFAELGIALEPPPRPNLDIKTLAKGRMVCLFPPNHPSRRNGLCCVRRTSRVFASSRRSRSVGSAQQWQRHFTIVRCHIHRTSPSCRAWLPCSLVASGLGVAIVDEFSAMQWSDRKLLAVPLEPAIVVALRLSALRTDHCRVSPGALSRS